MQVKYALIAMASVLMLGFNNAFAEDVTISAQAVKFAPLVVFIQPGDRVSWTNMSGHDSQSLEGVIPDGAEHWHLGMGENGSVTLNVEGVYLYKCTPHWGFGMGGAIIVGEPTNIEQVKANAQGAAKRLAIKANQAISQRAEAK